MSKKIILLASGNGSNVENICHFFEQNLEVRIIEVYTNNPDAGVLKRIKPFGLKGYIFNKTTFNSALIVSFSLSLVHYSLMKYFELITLKELSFKFFTILCPSEKK